MSIKLTFRLENGQVVLAALDKLQGQARFAAARALTKTARIGEGDARQEMLKVFDNPTRWTLNSLFSKPARKTDLVAFVAFRDYAAKGTAAGKYLKPEIYGGGRPFKKYEGALYGAGRMPGGLFSVPASGAQLDRHGNISSGQLKKVLTSVGASRDPMQNKRKGGKSTGSRRSEKYFSVTDTANRLGLGIYMRTGAKNRGVIPVFNYVGNADYQPRFHFHRVVQHSVAKNFNEQFDQSMDEALRTAR